MVRTGNKGLVLKTWGNEARDDHRRWGSVWAMRDVILQENVIFLKLNSRYSITGSHKHQTRRVSAKFLKIFITSHDAVIFIRMYHWWLRLTCYTLWTGPSPSTIPQLHWNGSTILWLNMQTHHTQPVLWTAAWTTAIYWLISLIDTYLHY